MEFIENYLTRNQVKTLIPGRPSEKLGMVVVIPCFNEPNLEATLDALWVCDKPNVAVEIIIVINDAENSAKAVKYQNRLTLEETLKWTAMHKDPQIEFYPIYCNDLPQKHAGVGLARKIGMDQAVLRFYTAKNKRGIIINLDADTVCDKNYLTAIENHFKENPKTPGASIYFEHPIIHPVVYKTVLRDILQYELHLRYLKQALSFIGHPHAFHTVGSCFAVTTDAYVKQGGMNKRQAGEDFHFIQKIIWLGNYTEINTTRVIPSGRISDRVPFGTGAAMKKISEEATKELLTYDFQSFVALKQLFSKSEKIYLTKSELLPELLKTLASPLQFFLQELGFQNEMQSIKDNTSGYASFKNRFFLWFDVFRVIKFLNQSHNINYSKQPVYKESAKMLAALQIYSNSDTDTELELIQIFRMLDCKGTVTI